MVSEPGQGYIFSCPKDKKYIPKKNAFKNISLNRSLGVANVAPIMEFVRSELVRDKTMKNFGRGDNLIASGIIDSLGILKLLVYLESKFSIHIDDDELIPENFETIEALDSFINRKVNGI